MPRALNTVVLVIRHGSVQHRPRDRECGVSCAHYHNILILPVIDLLHSRLVANPFEELIGGDYAIFPLSHEREPLGVERARKMRLTSVR